MEREWAKGLRYRNSHARNQALPHWLSYYNERRPLSRAGFGGGLDFRVLSLGRGSFGLMPGPRKYPPELLDRGARLVFDSSRPIAHVARDLGVRSETLRGYVRRVEAGEGV
jgi:Transposase